MRRCCPGSIIVVAFTLLWAVGCRHAATQGRDDGLVDAAAFRGQITTFEGLEGQLVFGSPRVHQGPYQPIEVSIPVRAAKDRAERVQYRFEYFDRTGRPIRPSMDWRYILLPVEGNRVMDGAALDAAAVDWRLEVRRAGRR